MEVGTNDKSCMSEQLRRVGATRSFPLCDCPTRPTWFSWCLASRYLHSPFVKETSFFATQLIYTRSHEGHHIQSRDRWRVINVKFHQLPLIIAVFCLHSLHPVWISHDDALVLQQHSTLSDDNCFVIKSGIAQGNTPENRTQSL